MITHTLERQVMGVAEDTQQQAEMQGIAMYPIEMEETVVEGELLEAMEVAEAILRTQIQYP